jgi:hypothetical protein
MNAHVFRRICQEMSPSLLNARLEKIHAFPSGVSQWILHTRHGTRALLLRAHRQTPFLYLRDTRLGVDAGQPDEILRLRRHLAGQRISAVCSHWTARRLWLRFTAHAPLWLCLDLRDGPVLQEEEPDVRAMEEDGARWPSLAELAGNEPEPWRKWPALSPLLRRTLPLLPTEEQAALLADLERGNGDIFVYRTPDGDESPELSAWPLPEPLRRGRSELVCADPLEAAALAGESLVLGALAREAAQRAARPYRRKAAGLERLLDKLEAQGERLRAMAAARADALALQREMYRFPPALKAGEVLVAHETREGSFRPLHLDPSLTVRENMEALFHRAKRGERGLIMRETRRAVARAAMAEAVDMAENALTGMFPANSAVAAHPAPAAGTRAPALPRGVQAFKSSDGLLMLRGKDARGNLAVLRMAGPDDMWLHAEGVAGAHVVVRLPPGASPPRETLLEAAALAALRSPYRSAGTAPVQCARVRHVHPVRGAPGLVRLDRREPGLLVPVDPDLEGRLAQIANFHGLP